jgi:ABC-type transport system involved in multi-copper enzyme maturation permease subunit
VAYFIFFCGFGATLAFFQNDEKSRSEALVLSLPVSRQAVVAGRYLSILIATILPSLTMAAFWALFHAAGLRIDALPARGFAVGLGAVLLFNAITLPVLFRFGAQKAGMAVVFVFFIPVFATTILKSLGINPLSWCTGASRSIIYAMGCTAVIASLALSFALSLRLYGKRQF